MAKKTIDGTIPVVGVGRSEESFLLEKEYARAIAALNRTGILTLLPRSRSSGVIGTDGKEYPAPTGEQLQKIFVRNKELVDRKMCQGFAQLQLTPIAMPTSQLIDLTKSAVVKRAAEGRIHQTRRSSSDPLVTVRVNTEKQVWIWHTLRQALDRDELVYFPREYSGNHRGQTKLDVFVPLRAGLSGWLKICALCRSKAKERQ